MCTSIGLPVFERKKSVDPPTDRASPAPSSDRPPPSARASISGISPNSLQRDPGDAGAGARRQHLRDLAELVTAPDLIGERRDGGSLVLAGEIGRCNEFGEI